CGASGICTGPGGSGCTGRALNCCAIAGAAISAAAISPAAPIAATSLIVCSPSFSISVDALVPPDRAHFWRYGKSDESGGILRIGAARVDGGGHVHVHAQLRRQLAHQIGIVRRTVGGIVLAVDQAQSHGLAITIAALQRRFGVALDRLSP